MVRRTRRPTFSSSLSTFSNRMGHRSRNSAISSARSASKRFSVMQRRRSRSPIMSSARGRSSLARCAGQGRKASYRNVRTPLTRVAARKTGRSEEHTSELQSLMRISYAVFCLKKKKKQENNKYQLINLKNHIKSNKPRNTGFTHNTIYPTKTQLINADMYTTRQRN